jgi:hypothetical protein
MRRNNSIVWLLALALVLASLPVRAQSADDRDYNIMTPEKPAPKKAPVPKQGETPRRHPRGSSTLVAPAPLPPPLHYNPPPVPTVTAPAQPVPPSMYVPQTGMVLPNLPGPVGSGPGGSETSQDRATRCANQAGIYGPAQTGNRNAYVGGCINQ